MFSKNKFNCICLIIIILYILYGIYTSKNVFNSITQKTNHLILPILNKKYEIRINKPDIDYVRTRDFMRVDCKNKMRVGGKAQLQKNAPDKLFRIDGAWY